MLSGRRRDPEGQGRGHGDIPARFQDFRVTRIRRDQAARSRRASRAREAELGRTADGEPAAEAVEEVRRRRDFGAGRNVRFGDLDGDGQIDMLIAPEHPARARRRLRPISCLTAVNLDGKVLWQSGRPDPRNGLLTNDTPFRSTTSTAMGRNEVVLVQDFKLQILDGRRAS